MLFIFIFIMLLILFFIFICSRIFSGFFSCVHFIIFIFCFYFHITSFTFVALITFTYIGLDAVSVITGRIAFRRTSVFFSSLHHPIATFTLIDCCLGILLCKDVTLFTHCSTGASFLKTSNSGVFWCFGLPTTFLCS